MLITKKLPHGFNYPQITQAPVEYAAFLNHFRGGHTIDDNLNSVATRETPQHNLLQAAFASGHLTKERNRAIPEECLVDILLTKAGEGILQSSLDRRFCILAVAEARKSVSEDDGKLHPYVGAVIVKGEQILATGYRGETGAGRHAEFCALKKVNDNVDQVDLTGCTVYTTLEPCSERKSPSKIACATRLINAGAFRVVYGLADKDASVYGHVSLTEANIHVDLFPSDLTAELTTLNSNWSATLRTKQKPVPSNSTLPIATVSYYKPGSSMADNIHLYLRPAPEDQGNFTIEDGAGTVLASGRTLQEIAVKWRQIDSQMTIVDGLQRQNHMSSNALLTL